MEPRRRLSRGRIATIALLVAWFVAVLVWALQPVDDSVPTGIVAAQPTAQVVQCDSPLSGNDGPTSPPPSLPAGRAYERAPCSDMHTQYRALFWLDSALVFVLVALVLTVGRRPKSTHDAAPSTSTYAPSVVQ